MISGNILPNILNLALDTHFGIMTGKMAKGTFWLMVAMIVFMVSGYAIHFGLARVVTPEEYGIYGIVLSILAITQIFLENGVLQSVSKFVAEGRDIKEVRKAGIKTQLLFLSIIFPVYFFSAPFIAKLLGDPSLTIYIRLSSFLIPMRAIHVVQLGLLEGTKEFGKDAGIRAFYDIIRVAAVFLFVYLGFKIIGVIYGFILASMCILIIGWYYVKNLRTQGEKKLKWRDIASFSLPIIVFAVVYTAIMNIDILFVKSLITGSEYTGYYTSAWAIARVPFYIFSALFFTIVPSISRSRAEDNLEQTQDYISHSLRYYSMIVIPIAFLTLATAPALLSFLFTPEYGVAGDTLRILIFGMSFFAAFIIMSMILIGAGKPFIPMVIGIILLPIDVILSYIFVLTWGPNGAALSLAIVALIGMCIVAV
jgi:PST family polysaccharide transporter